MIERDLDGFFRKIAKKSPKTQSRMKSALKNFDKFCNEIHKKNMDQIILELKKESTEGVYDFLQEWINWSKQAPRGLRAYFGDIKKYLRYMGIEITLDDIKDELDFPKVIHEELHPVSDSELHAIFSVCDYSFKVNTITECQSGIRRGELVQIRKKHFVFGKKRLLIKIPPSIAKFGKARTVIMGKEAGIMLTPKLNKLSDEDLVFAKNKIGTHALQNDEQKLRNYLDKLGLNKRYETTNNYIINTHSFRAWFITRMSRKDRDLAYLLAGQKGYLLGYDRLSDDEKLEEYLKHEGDLLIFDNSKRDHKSEKDSQRIEQLEKEVEEFREFKKQYFANLGIYPTPKNHNS